VLHVIAPHQTCPAQPATYLNWSQSGIKGERGLRGLTGDTGPAGSRGPAGPKGATGDQGAKGVAGVAGQTGSTGPAGDVGSIGPTGPQGPTGPTGPDGPVGATGSQGAPGVQGATGGQGPAGGSGITNYSVQVGSSTMNTTQGVGVSALLSVACPNGTHLLGGGAHAGSQEADLVVSAPLVSSGQPTDTWQALFKVKPENAQGDSFEIDAFAFCGNIAP
jgi:hypothetical protein